MRGHFPLELDVLQKTLAQPADVWLVIPFFLEGGRFTINDVHYVAEKGGLVPAAQTPFARDKAFGYTASDLKAWVVEKGEGRFSPAVVHSITLEQIRSGGPDRVTERLLALPAGSICVVNSASYRDQEVFVRGLLAAEARGGRFLYRTAASFVRPRIGLGERPLLTAAELRPAAEAVRHHLKTRKGR